jgi:hypothetical protein
MEIDEGVYAGVAFVLDLDQGAGIGPDIDLP